MARSLAALQSILAILNYTELALEADQAIRQYQSL